jgi:hypothetical protein
VPRSRSPGQAALFGGRAARVSRARRGCDNAVTKLRRADRLDVDRPDLVAVARTLADAFDRENTDPAGSGFTLARLAAEYRSVMAEAAGTAVTDQGDPFGLGADAGYPALRDPPRP